MVVGVDAREALAELTLRSKEIERAVIVDDTGEALAATAGAPAARLARLGSELLHSAALVRPGATVERVEVTLTSGSVFALRVGGLVAVATTPPEPVSALVVHDLRACLEHVDVPAVASSGATDG
jgi:hypothetical protein